MWRSARSTSCSQVGRCVFARQRVAFFAANCFVQEDHRVFQLDQTRARILRGVATPSTSRANASARVSSSRNSRLNASNPAPSSRSRASPALTNCPLAIQSPFNVTYISPVAIDLTIASSRLAASRAFIFCGNVRLRTVTSCCGAPSRSEMRRSSRKPSTKSERQARTLFQPARERGNGVHFFTAAVQTGNEKTGPTAVVLAQPLSRANRIVRRRHHDRLQRRSEHAFDRTFPLRVDVQRIGKRADEMKIARRLAGRKDELDGGRVISAALVQLFQTLEAMTRARILVTHSGQLSFRVADRFMTTHDGIDRDFAFGLQFSDTRTGVAELTRKALGFEFSFRVLAGGAIAFTRQTFSLL